MRHAFAQELLKQGIAASKAGQSQHAHRLLLKAIQLDPANETAWLWLSGVVDGVAERRHCLEQVLRLNPGNRHARAGLAWLERHALQSTPLVIEPSSGTETAALSGSNAASQELCPFCKSIVSRHNTTCPHCHCTLIVTCPECETPVDIELTTCRACGYKLGDYRKGTAYWAALGDAYLANQKASPAVTAWRQVLEMDASYPGAYLRLAEAQTIAGDWEGARANLERAVDHVANPVAAHVALGRIYEHRHQWEQAQQAYQQAITTDPSSAVAHFALGRLLMEANSFQEAFPHIRRATELDPGNAGAWTRLGHLYEMAQEWRKAIRAYERAVTLVERKPAASSEWSKRAAQRLELLRPSLPPSVALNWAETVRQTAARALIPAVAALVNAGLLPWQVAPLDYLGVLVATLGAYFWVSASILPYNPGMRAMLGQDGLSQPSWRMTVGLLGGLFWGMGSLYVLLAPALT